jgi:hypothetical protein
MSKAAVESKVAETFTADETGSAVFTASLPGQCLAEFLGTFVVILVGDGAVAAAVMAGSIDNWGVAVMWGLAVTFGIYVAGPVSGDARNDYWAILIGSLDRKLTHKARSSFLRAC